MLAIAYMAVVFPATVLAADCRAPSTQLDMNQCAKADDLEAATAMRGTYEAVLGRSSPEQKKLLRVAQHTWEAYREANCLFSAFNAQGGSAFPMAQALCFTRMTEARNKELAHILHCEEGDISCSL